MSEKSRLLWRCRRGIREMDIVFTDFIEQCYDQLTEAEKQHLDALLEESDLDILNWVMGKEQATNNDLQLLIERIRASRNLPPQ